MKLWHDTKKDKKGKTKKIFAVLVVTVLLCSMLPIAAFADGWDDVPDGGIVLAWGSSGFLNITMPTTENYYTYGNAGSWSAQETAVNVSTLPASNWDWAVQKESDGYRMILNGMYMGFGNSNGGLMYKCDLTLELRNKSVLNSWSSSAENAAIKGSGELTIVGNGSLEIRDGYYGLSVDGPLNIIGGKVTVGAMERAIVASSVELSPGIHALTSGNANGTDAQTYFYGNLQEAKWFQAAYAATGSSYTVRFDPEDYHNNSTGTGTMANVENVVGAYTLPDVGFTPEPGMRFKAWKTDNGERMPGELILITANTTIYAVWEDDPDTFTVSYYSRGNSSGYMNDVKGVAGSFTLPANAFTSPPGMLFKAWSVDDIEYAPGDTIEVTKDTYVYAVWKDVPATIAAFFDPNGGRGNMWSKSENATAPFQCTLPANEWPNQFYGPTNTYFAGWLVGEILMQPGDTITVTEDTVVKAAWEIDEYHVTVGGVRVDYQNAHNITSSSISGTVSYDYETQTLTLNNATIYSVYSGGTVTSAISTDYFDFEGKLTILLIGDNTIYGDLVSGPATSSHRYAVWVKDLVFEGDGSLTVTASQAGGASFYDAISSDKDIEVKGGCTITAIANSSSGSALSCNYGSGKLIAENSTVLASTSSTGTPLGVFSFNSTNRYVKIVPAYNITVAFDANSGSGTMADANAVCSKEYTLPECGFTPPAGKRFKAWSVNGNEKQSGDKVVFIENATVTALWEDDNHVCNIEPVEKVWPDCENGGKEAYYHCEGCGKSFEDANGTTEIANIETWGNLAKLGHTEGEEWESDEDNHWHICSVEGCGAVVDCCKAAHTPDREAATETDPVKCSVCGYIMEEQLSHTHVFDKEVAEDQYKAGGETCTEPAEYYKSCACGEKGTETFVNGAANGHTHDTEWKSDKDNHWNECACGDKVNTAAHKDENADGKCDVCAYNVGLSTPPADPSTPQTGDNTQLGLWIALLIVSSFGVAAIALSGKKKYSAR